MTTDFSKATPFTQAQVDDLECMLGYIRSSSTPLDSHMRLCELERKIRALVPAMKAAVDSYGAGQADAVAKPDKNCFTLENGDCIGTGGCMHDAHPPAASARLAELLQALENLAFHSTAACDPGVTDMQRDLTRMSIAHARAVLAGGRA